MTNQQHGKGVLAKDSEKHICLESALEHSILLWRMDRRNGEDEGDNICKQNESQSALKSSSRRSDGTQAQRQLRDCEDSIAVWSASSVAEILQQACAPLS